MSIWKTDRLCFSLRVVNVKKLSMRVSVCHPQTWRNLYAWLLLIVCSDSQPYCWCLSSCILFFVLLVHTKWQVLVFWLPVPAFGRRAKQCRVSFSHQLGEVRPIFLLSAPGYPKSRHAHCLPPRNLRCICNALLCLIANCCVIGHEVLLGHSTISSGTHVQLCFSKRLEPNYSALYCLYLNTGTEWFLLLVKYT